MSLFSKYLTSLLLFSLFAPLLLGAPKNFPVPGGVAVFDISKSGVSRVEFMGKRGVLFTKKGAIYALVPIPLWAKEGRYEVKFYGVKTSSLPLEIGKREYAVQRLTVKNRRKVEPNRKDLARIAKERERKAKAKAFRSNEYANVDMVWPVSGVVSSPFGLRRYFNGKPRSPHSGIDIAAPEGEKVFAAADGVVVDTGNFFFSGNLVFIEHGNGLMTLYAHLSRIDVRPGERVKKGEPVGLVGSTGRVTGPHLHFAVLIDGVYVDPMLFLPETTMVKRVGEEIE